jgi:hypothetical protein
MRIGTSWSDTHASSAKLFWVRSRTSPELRAVPRIATIGNMHVVSDADTALFATKRFSLALPVWANKRRI